MNKQDKSKKNSGKSRLEQAIEHSARTMKEHDFDKIGYDANVVSVYAGLVANGPWNTGAGISSKEAERLINSKFKELYGQTPEQYMEGKTVKIRTPWQTKGKQALSEKARNKVQRNHHSKAQEQGRER